MRRLLSVLVYMSLMLSGFSQSVIHINIDQPDLLQTTTGSDTTILLGESLFIGNNLTITGGVPLYNFQWSPNLYLDNDTLENPTSTPDDSITYYLTVTDVKNCSSADSITIAVLFSTVIHDRDVVMDFSVYPIPSTKFLSIIISNITDDLTIEIIDINGGVHWNDNVPFQSGTIQKTIDINLSDGIYILRITDSSGNIKLKKLVITN